MHRPTSSLLPPSPILRKITSQVSTQLLAIILPSSPRSTMRVSISSLLFLNTLSKCKMCPFPHSKVPVHCSAKLSSVDHSARVIFPAGAVSMCSVDSECRVQSAECDTVLSGLWVQSIQVDPWLTVAGWSNDDNFCWKHEAFQLSTNWPYLRLRWQWASGRTETSKSVSSDEKYTSLYSRSVTLD